MRSECRRTGGEGGVLRADVEELVDFKLQALAAERRGARRVERVEAKRAVIASAERSADGEVGDRHVEHVRQRVDVVGAAGEAAGRIDLQGLRVCVAELEGVAVVGIAVAERHDVVDALGGRGRGERKLRQERSHRESRGQAVDEYP